MKTCTIRRPPTSSQAKSRTKKKLKKFAKKGRLSEGVQQQQQREVKTSLPCMASSLKPLLKIRTDIKDQIESPPTMSDLFSMGNVQTPRSLLTVTTKKSGPTWEDIRDNLSSLIEKLDWLRNRIQVQKSKPKASGSISKELGGILNYLAELSEFADVKDKDLLNCIPTPWKSTIQSFYLGINSENKIYKQGQGSPAKSDDSNFLTFSELANIGTQDKSDLIQENIQLKQELRAMNNLKLELIEEKGFYQSQLKLEKQNNFSIRNSL